MKKVFQFLVAAIVIFAIGGLVISFTIDGMVESSIERTSGEMLQTSVSVEDMAISILNGRGTIAEITIHNPKGFSDNPAVQLKQIRMNVDLYSLFSDTVIVKRIDIEKPELFFEQKEEDTNLGVLTENLGGSSSAGTNLIVDHLLVQDGTVTLSTDIRGEQSTQATFDRFELKGIGRKGNNTMAQTMRQILEPVLQKAAREAAQQGLLDKAEDKLKELIDS